MVILLAYNRDKQTDEQGGKEINRNIDRKAGRDGRQQIAG
jgi:hypothetical protein